MVPTFHAVSTDVPNHRSIMLNGLPSYPLTLLGNLVYSLATRFHLIPIAGPDVEVGAYSQVPGTARAEAERRRYIQFIL